MNFTRLVFAALAVFIGATGISFAGESLVYFGTYTTGKSKGIYVARFDDVTGKLSQPELAAEIQNPSFLAVHPDGHQLFACGEMSDGGTVSAFSLEPKTGRLAWLGQQNSGGSGPCHISVDASGKCLLVANYGSGSIAALPIHDDGSLAAAATVIHHHGSSVNLNRQAGPHAHFMAPSPDNRFALNCDLGLDKVFVYQLDPIAAKLTPNDPPFALMAPGSGPRHLVFARDGRFVYVISEMAGTITVFSYKPANAAMTEVQTISTLPKDFTDANTAAEIALRPDGKFLYASNRGDDSIGIFSVNRKTGRLTLMGHQSSLGHTPRHFRIDPTGHWLLVENQAADSVVVFAINSKRGMLKPTGQTITIGSPVCAVFVPEK